MTKLFELAMAHHSPEWTSNSVALAVRHDQGSVCSFPQPDMLSKLLIGPSRDVLYPRMFSVGFLNLVSLLFGALPSSIISIVARISSIQELSATSPPKPLWCCSSVFQSFRLDLSSPTSRFQKWLLQLLWAMDPVSLQCAC